MDRNALFTWAEEEFGARPERLWLRFPEYAVLRGGSGKWFAVVMNVPAGKLGLTGGGTEILNVKCGPLIIGSLLTREDVLPAYHMNKTSWASVLLERADDEFVKELVRVSYKLTSPAKKKGRS